MQDIRDEIFCHIENHKVTAAIKADDNGIIVEIEAVKLAAEELGLIVSHVVEEGSPVKKGDSIIQFSGTPKQTAMAEERLIGYMAKPSGIATAARRFVETAGPDIQIVSGAWKKIHASQKEVVRRAIVAAGASCRICQEPFLYIDKNCVKMLGGIRASLLAISRISGYTKVIQIEGRTRSIAIEANEAAENGADIIFIDNGNQSDIQRVSESLTQNGRRSAVKLAFAGGVRLEDIDRLRMSDVNILDIGRAVIDAPLLDMRMEILRIVP